MKTQSSEISQLSKRSIQSLKRLSRSGTLMQKVPLELKVALREQKQNQAKQINLTDIYEDFKRSFTDQNDCNICFMKVTKRCSIADCQHIFCEGCLISYLTYKINSMEQIICPNEDCDRKLDLNSQIFKNLPEKYKQKYKKQQLWLQTISNPNLKICPLEYCINGIVDMRLIPAQCGKCHTVFCQQCMMKYHPGKPCSQIFKQNFKSFKRCPSCQMFIQKNQGCNHMVCRCKYQFCFLCLSEWSSNHSSCGLIIETNFFDRNRICCPKLISVLMCLIIPFLFIISIAICLLGFVICFVGGFFSGLITIKWSNNLCRRLLIIIFLPIFCVIGAIVGSIGGTFFYLIPYILQYFGRYKRTIINLWQIV